ncbi:hypothetical protein O6H91_Y443300 [Diphasiastrum complanatum]|nr:hypothetical protein O6H91_Y443300 [Diphasiastrum complanatum]
MDTFIQFSTALVYPSSMARYDFNPSAAPSIQYGRKISSLSKISARSSLAAATSCLCSFWHPDLAAFPSQISQTCKSHLKSCALSGCRFACPMKVPHLKITSEISHGNDLSFGSLISSRRLNVQSSQKSITRLLCQAGKRHTKKASAVFHGFGRKRVRALILDSQKRFQEICHTKAKTFLVKSAYISPPPADLSISSDIDKRNNDQSFGSSAEEIRKPKAIITSELLRDLLWKERGHIVVATVALLGATCCTLTMPIFSGRFFETLIGTRSEPLWRLLAKLSAIYALEPVCTIVFITNMIKVWERVMASLRSSLFRRLILQKVEFFDKHKVGELTAMLSTDLSSLKDIVHENVSRDRGFRAFSETIGTLIILFFVSPKLAPILGMLVLFVSAFAAIYKRQSVPAFIAYGQVQASISDCANETFAAIRTVRSFGGEKRQISAFDKLVFALQRSGDSLGWLKSLNESCTRVVIYVSLMALYILGGMKVKAGELAVGNMVSFIGYTFVLTFAVQGLVSTFADIRATLAAVDRINFIVQEADVDESLARGIGIEKEAEDDNNGLRDRSGTVSERSSRAVSTIVSGKYRFMPTLSNNVCDLAWSGDVALEDVHFAYPLRPDVEVLKGTNLVLSQGTVTAVVGSSGAGKSTIVQLLARFYEVSASCGYNICY